MLRALEAADTPLRFNTPIVEQRTAESGTYGEYAPGRNVFHEWSRAQTLRHRVIVHDDRCVAVADSRNGSADFIRQIEAPSFRAGWTSSFD